MRQKIPDKNPVSDELTDPVVATGSADQLALCSLVLSAVGIRHTIHPGHAALTVPPEFAANARHHLDSYFEENRGWPELPPRQQNIVYTGNPPTLLIIGGLALFYLVTGPWQDNVAWFAHGAVDSKAILIRGEWWRVVTALTLHADQVHLIGNCVIGGFIVHLLSRTLGYGLGLILLLLCGAMGNFLNVAVRDGVHLSVGFSTAIFAGIGLLSGLQAATGRLSRLRNLLLPVGAGAGLLAMLGTEGERTDLGAHLFGFLSGLAVGILARRLPLDRVVNAGGLQEKLFILALALVLVSWTVAMH